MTGYEDILDDQGAAAGALETDHMPVVADLVVTERHQETAEVDRTAVLDHRAADEGPGRMVTARGPQPGAVDEIAAVDDHPAPIGAYDEEIRTVGSEPQTSSWARWSNCARCQL